MTDSFKPADPTSASLDAAKGKVPAEAGRTLMVGVLGGLLSAAGYLVYQRLPDEQKERLHKQVRSQLEARINEVRANFNL